MAISATPYGKTMLHLGNGLFNFTTDTLKVALTTSSYSPNVDTHDFFDDITNEIVGTGYTAGGATLAGVTWTYDATNNRAQLAATNTTWTTATFTTRRAVVYKSTGTAATSPLLCWVDFGANQSPAGTNFTIPWPLIGLFNGTVV